MKRLDREINCVFILVLLTGFIGCSTPYTFPSDARGALKHIVSIDREGNFIPLTPGKVVDDEASISYRKAFLRQQKKLAMKDELDEALLTDPDLIYQEHLERIFAGVRQQKNKKILIFIHGGLNTLETSVSRAVEDCKRIQDHYPIFINWHNGALDTYLGQAFDVRNGKPAPPSSLTTGVPYILSDIAKALVLGPRSILIQMDHFYEGEFNKKVFKTPEGENVVFTGKEMPNIVFQKLKEPLFALKLFTAPLVDVFGASSWNNMRRRIFNLYRKPAEFEVHGERSVLLPHLDEFFQAEHGLTETEKIEMAARGSGALSVFMNQFREVVKPNKAFGNSAQKYEITLVGHSMGTIVLNELIRKFPKLEYKEIIYLAAACSIRDFMNKTVPYLENHPKTRFYNLTLHPEAEDAEINWGSLLPRGSLLAWIDNRYTTPETHLDRTLGRWSNVEGALHVFSKNIRSQLHFKVFGFAENEPVKHGDFTNAEPNHEYWNSELWKKE